MDTGGWEATVLGVTRVGHDLATKPPPWMRGGGPDPLHCPSQGVLAPTSEQEAGLCVSMELSIYLLNCGVGEDS